ncbi:MAG: imidazolonepropionase [Actinomycetota bacterium]|nr:imidazolonepropionase [Actinomycetota bacterium]MDP3629980.1 imidazolonepropionase [Actinomycetota bacterium]
MTATLITNIGELVTNDSEIGDGSRLGILRDAAIVLDGNRVAWVGRATDAPATDTRVDVEGRAVVPGFVDSHTHLVFAGERSAEFAARMAGEPYTGGGIMTTVAATRAASTDELRENTRRLLAEATASGTTTVEIKSGYGLTIADERRLLEVASEFTDETTFLGAHVVPAEYANDRAAYVDLVCGEMLVACAPLARWIDVFCDTGAFDEAETRRVLAAGIAAGLLPRLHGNQLEHGPGVRLAVEFGAASVDHCTYLSSVDIDSLAASTTVATLLPGADFSTRAPYADARRLLDAGVTIALATDCNPGSSYTTSMPLMIALAVREMRLTPAEALFAATTGGAAALRRDDIGRLAPGMRADLVVLDAPSYVHLAYRPGAPAVSQTWRGGAKHAL